MFPREHGGTNSVDNYRYVCADCNVLRAACGHCVGAMACVVDLAARLNVKPMQLTHRFAQNRRTARRRWGAMVTYENYKARARHLPLPYPSHRSSKAITAAPRPPANVMDYRRKENPK